MGTTVSLYANCEPRSNSSVCCENRTKQYLSSFNKDYP